MKKQNKLESYLAVTAGVGCVSSVANAATVISLNNLPDPLTGPALLIDNDLDGGAAGFSFGTTIFLLNDSSGNYIFRSTGAAVTAFDTYYQDEFYYMAYGASFAGGTLGTDNFVAFNATDSNQNQVSFIAQFFFDNEGNGSLLGIASNNDGAAFSFDDGVAALQAAQVPEPSSIALLALGSLGLAARRNRKK